MTLTDSFYAWRELKIIENPTWCDEDRDWFLGMYLQTYPARSFPLTVELFDFFEGKGMDDDERKSDDNPVDGKDQAGDSERGNGEVPAREVP